MFGDKDHKVLELEVTTEIMTSLATNPIGTRCYKGDFGLPNCKSYHQWHSTWLKGNGLRSKDAGGIKAKREKTTLRNIMVKANVGPHPSRPSTYSR